MHEPLTRPAGGHIAEILSQAILSPKCYLIVNAEWAMLYCRLG
jgi:hypothetical protein